MAQNQYFYGLGRRKTATARVRLSSGKGGFIINGQPADEYFDKSKHLADKLQQSLFLLELDPAKFDISVRVTGGGITGQTEAIRLGISKALVVLNEEYRPTLRRADLLGRDPREKERKKFGLKGARKKRQFTKR